MLLYKQPPYRVRIPRVDYVGEPHEGSFLYNIIKNNGCGGRPILPIRPVYHQDAYLKLLEKNQESLGLPYINPNLPVLTYRPPPPRPTEPELDVPDRVYLRMRILKNGAVRVKLNAMIWDLYEKYYKHAKHPPFKSIMNAYKAHGFSKQYLERIKRNSDATFEFSKKVPGIIKNIFEREPVKKKKVKAKEKKIDDDIEEEVPIDDTIPTPVPEEDDGALDVEPEEDEEVVEEEYVSDGE